MPKQNIRILTNLRGLNGSFVPESTLSFSYIGTGNGLRETLRFIRECWRADLVILNIDIRKLMLVCALKWVLPLLRCKVVSVDLILRTPRTAAARAKAYFKRMLFRKVDRFVLYFKDLRGYEKFYGISEQRLAYVPFKVNGWDEIRHRHIPGPDGDYILCAGRTLRDIETFVKAVARTDYPAILLQQNRELLSGNGTKPWHGELPPNIRLIVDKGDERETFIQYISNARAVVIPRFKHDIAASGISTYLLAMALNKCVIISEGPGANDVLSGQAMIVPAEDADSLTERITEIWNDSALRTSVSSRGREYAVRVGGEERLYRDILQAGLQALNAGRLAISRPDQKLLKPTFPNS